MNPLALEWLQLAVPHPIGVAFVLVGGWIARRGLRQRADRDRVEAVETTPVRALSEGRVQIEGTARPLDGRTLSRPFAPGEDALVVDVEVEDAGESGRRGSRWDTVHRERESVPFLVVDDAGDAVVVEPPDGGEFVLEGVSHRTGLLRRTPAVVREYVERTPGLERAGVDLGVARLPGSDRRYTERTLRPGEDVYVLGEATAADDLWSAEHPYTVSGDPESFVLGDRHEAGVVDELSTGARRHLAVGGFFVLLGLLLVVSSWPGTPL